MTQVSSVDRLVRDSCARFGQQTLLVSANDGTRVSFEQLDRASSRAANVLAALGVERGQTVSLFLRNSLDFFPPWLGTIRLGGVANPINLGVEKDVDRIAYMLRKARSRVFVLDEPFTELARDIRARVPEALVIVLGRPELSAVDWRRELEAAPASFRDVHVRKDDPFQMIFTSGTTGPPKAVVQHHEMLTDAFAIAEHFGFGATEVIQLVLPLFHVNAQYTSFFPALGLGMALVVCEKFSASGFFATVAAHGVNYASVVPSLLTRLLAHPIPPREQYRTLKFLICGAAPLTVDLHRRFMEETGIPVPNGWGMTETGCWGCHTKPDRIVLGSMGRPLAINELRIIDPESGAATGPGTVGRLLVRGLNVFREYYDAPEATARAFRFGEGWFDTGDDVRSDDTGNLFFVGRGSVDTGKVDGEFVNFQRLDEMLWTHPDVEEVCCVGVPDPVRGQAVAACVVGKPERHLTASAVQEFCRARGFARYEMPAYVLLVDEIPKGDTGKIQRKVMTERAVERLGLTG